VVETRLSPKLRFQDSPIHGKGIFASSGIIQNEIVLTWGDGYTDREGAMEAFGRGKAIMQWDDDIFSYEGDHDDNDDPYSINHSCDPNCWMADAHTLIARRDIGAGEEITADYALWESDEDFVSGWECCCGSSLCRGRITGRDWRLKELQERYRAHFSPLLNKRIARLDRTID